MSADNQTTDDIIDHCSLCTPLFGMVVLVHLDNTITLLRESGVVIYKRKDYAHNRTVYFFVAKENE